MPTLTINGHRVTVDESFLSLSPEQQNATVDEIAQSLGAQPDAQTQPASHPQSMSEVDAFNARLKANMGNGSRLGQEGPASGAENLLQAMTFNRADDIARLFGADKFAENINAKQKAFREAHPIGSVAYDALGAGMTSAAGGAMAAKALPGVAAYMNPAGRGMAARMARYGGMGAAQAGAYASGEEGATAGDVGKAALVGGAIGAAVPVAEKMAQGAYNKVMGKGAQALPGISSNIEEMAQQADDISSGMRSQARGLYQQMDQAGAVVRKSSADRLRQNMTIAGGRINTSLREKTAGLVQETQDALKGNVSFERLHELSRTFNRVLRGSLSGEDKTSVLRMKQVLDGYIAKIGAGDLVRGTPDTVKMLRQADKLWAQGQKVDLIENILDMADVKTGRYTQSGLANTIRQQAEKLYVQIKNGKARGFSPDEIALVRKMAKGGDVGALTRFIAKMNPKGVISSFLPGSGGASAGAAIGTAIGGPAGGMVGGGIGAALPPLAGKIAAGQAERAAIGNMGRLLGSAAYGPQYLAPPMPLMLPRSIENVLYPAGVGFSSAIGQR